MRCPTMASPSYRLFAWAVENHAPLRCRYKGFPREFCPITLGHNTEGDEVAHVWQTGGVTSGKLPAWRTFQLDNVRDLEFDEGEWESGSSKGGRAPTMHVDYDANRKSPYGPAHSLGELRGMPRPKT